MSKRTVIGIILVLIVLLIFSVTFFLVDFNLVVRNNEPKLCINIKVYNDGATKEYVGLGYKIIRYNTESENLVNKFGTWFLAYDETLNVKDDNKGMTNPSGTYDIVGEITSFDEKDQNLQEKDLLLKA